MPSARGGNWGCACLRCDTLSIYPKNIGGGVYQSWASAYAAYNTIQATTLFTAANFTDQDHDGWGYLPDGTAFTLTLDMGD